MHRYHVRWHRTAARLTGPIGTELPDRDEKREGRNGRPQTQMYDVKNPGPWTLLWYLGTRYKLVSQGTRYNVVLRI